MSKQSVNGTLFAFVLSVYLQLLPWCKRVLDSCSVFNHCDIVFFTCYIIFLKYLQNLWDMWCHCTQCCWRADKWGKQYWWTCGRINHSNWGSFWDSKLMSWPPHYEFSSCLHDFGLCHFLALSLPCATLNFIKGLMSFLNVDDKQKLPLSKMSYPYVVLVIENSKLYFTTCYICFLLIFLVSGAVGNLASLGTFTKTKFLSNLNINTHCGEKDPL